ncbi:uncharacterized protein MELLADRAFT_116457 [Melampsora larici-populina 98AG31]|uniref:AMP-dependent synthetase/ligase domain-containing protein n=1 Tax=Melampsora larici-populina (strain 98AG31 / pathotype 3-4-7) TaxID=747676 RepID=F4RLH9_MELLP|nr:uncharacterized protein MELLADRAFT_116457 [Melampsora larici-populina 98AG31]EGG06540.1 hypothetical protein MELLADRAFT_116457 [Melampsora larici-populina 98AG31]
MSSLPPYAVTNSPLPVLISKPLDLNKQAIEVPGSRKPGQTGHFRNALFPDFTTVEEPGKNFPKTEYESFNHGLGVGFDKPCLGHRPINPTTGDFEPYFVWQTYAEIDKRRTEFGSGLIKLRKDGLLGSGDLSGWTVGIWTQNRPEWQVCYQACAAYSLVVVSLYETLGPQIVEYCINHSDTRLVMASAVHIPNLLTNATAYPALKVIVSADPWDSLEPLPKPKSGSIGDRKNALKQWGKQLDILVLDISELEAIGRENPSAHIPPSPSTTMSICYTSGTTGLPKGAILLHRSMAASAVSNLHGNTFVGVEEMYLSYLPLSHIFERFLQSTCFAIGQPIAFACGDNLRLLEDIKIAKPTRFVSVPRVLNRIYQAVNAQLDQPGFKGFLARKALASKLDRLRSTGSIYHPFWDRIVFSKVKEALGGRVKLIASGSAPIAPEVLEFLKVAFVTDVIEGYGATENTGTTTRCWADDPEPAGTVGAPQVGVEFKLVDVPDMKYFSTDKPYPRGEICVRGEVCIPGYLNDETKTKELIDSEGWQHSGDIGLVDEKGRLKIIDRIKNLLKLSQGEYVALEKVEGTYSLNNLIAQIFVHGDSLESHLIAVIVPDPITFGPFASKVLGKPIEGESEMKSACEDKKVIERFLKELNLSVSEKLLGFEKVKQIYLTLEPFTTENDLLTPTLKLKRNVAKEKFGNVIKKLYDEARGEINKSKIKL